jgi:hypothetical protein
LVTTKEGKTENSSSCRRRGMFNLRVHRTAAPHKPHVTTTVPTAVASGVLVAIHCRNCSVSEQDTWVGCYSTPDFEIDCIQARHHHVGILSSDRSREKSECEGEVVLNVKCWLF